MSFYPEMELMITSHASHWYIDAMKWCFVRKAILFLQNKTLMSMFTYVEASSWAYHLHGRKMTHFVPHAVLYVKWACNFLKTIFYSLERFGLFLNSGKTKFFGRPCGRSANPNVAVDGSKPRNSTRWLHYHPISGCLTENTFLCGLCFDWISALAA
jgi:hypothetical protein